MTIMSITLKVCKRGHSRSPDKTRCFECTKLKNRERSARHRENPEYLAEQAIYQKEYRARTKDQRKQYLEENKEARSKNQRTQFLRKKYGITQKDFETMLAAQLGCCKICGEQPNLTNTKHNSLSVDHCHVTGKVRGLLCDRCNKGIGLLKDDVNRLISAIKYLEENK